MKISIYFNWANSFLNQWSFWHLLGGVFLTKVFMWSGFTSGQVVLLVFGMSLLWEAIEYAIENWRPYGTVKKYLVDTAMDVFLATMVSIWIVL